jgi:hypothetical protein
MHGYRDQVRKNPSFFFDLPFRILRNCVFMRGQRRPRRPLIIALGAMLASAQPPVSAPGVSSDETLEYEIEWRLVTAGRAKLTMDKATAENRASREMKLHLESSGLVSRLFHVNDDYTSDTNQDFCAESTFMTAHEAGRSRETKVVYDPKNLRASFTERDLIKNATTSGETSVPPCVHDIVGGLYRLRSMNMEPGKSTQLPVSDGKKSVMVKIECQRREEIKTPMGPKKTLLYEVFAFNNVLYRRPGHLHIWLSDDARRIPVQIEIRLQFTIGTVTLKLDKQS